MKALSQPGAQSLLQHCPVAMLVTGADGKVLDFNKAFAALVGDTASSLQGASPADGLVTALLGPETIINWIMPDGDERWLAVESCSIEAAPGVTARFYQDITEKLRLKKERDSLQAELAQQALRDARLPGLLSRFGLQVTLDPLVSRSRRYDSPLSLVCIGIETDSDRDKVITRISYLLKDQTRWADLVGCNTEHDFILVLQETNRDAALQLVDKLLVRFTEMEAATEDRIRACFAVTDCQKNDDAESILERVETTLAEARKSDDGIAVANPSGT